MGLAHRGRTSILRRMANPPGPRQQARITDGRSTAGCLSTARRAAAPPGAGAGPGAASETSWPNADGVCCRTLRWPWKRDGPGDGVVGGLPGGGGGYDCLPPFCGGRDALSLLPRSMSALTTGLVPARAEPQGHLHDGELHHRLPHGAGHLAADRYRAHQRAPGQHRQQYPVSTLPMIDATCVNAPGGPILRRGVKAGRHGSIMTAQRETNENPRPGRLQLSDATTRSR